MQRPQPPASEWSHTGLLFCVLVALVVSPTTSSARSTGIGTAELIDPATTGCNFCHGGGSQPRVTLEGPTPVMPGTTNTYVFRVFSTGNQGAAGFNVSAPAGTLATGGPDSTLTRALPGTGDRTEITHAAPKGAEGDAARFSFQWTAPAEAGTVTLRLWGNAVNGNGQPTGDRASTLLVPIAVLAAEPLTPTPTPTETAAPTATATPGEAPPCPGNCNGDDAVTVDEILTGVGIAQGFQALDVCPAFDANGDSQVTIDDILAAVGAALTGCPG